MNKKPPNQPLAQSLQRDIVNEDPPLRDRGVTEDSPVLTPEETNKILSKVHGQSDQRRLGQPYGGRPTLLDRSLMDKICKYIATGIHVDTAAGVCGIPRQRLYEWLRRGAREPGTIYAEFQDKISESIDLAETRFVNVISQASNNGAWKASSWLLERRFSQRWGRQDRAPLDVSGAKELGEMNGLEIESELAAIDAEFRSIGSGELRIDKAEAPVTKACVDAGEEKAPSPNQPDSVCEVHDAGLPDQLAPSSTGKKTRGAGKGKHSKTSRSTPTSGGQE